VGDVLRTWRLAAPPQPRLPIDAELIFDHRKLYLDYEGPVSGNRGNVTRGDRGVFLEAPSGPGVGGNPTVVRLQGERVGGVVALEQVDGVRWTWILRPDAAANESGGELV